MLPVVFMSSMLVVPSAAEQDMLLATRASHADFFMTIDGDGADVLAFFVSPIGDEVRLFSDGSP